MKYRFCFQFCQKTNNGGNKTLVKIKVFEEVENDRSLLLLNVNKNGRQFIDKADCIVYTKIPKGTYI